MILTPPAFEAVCQDLDHPRCVTFAFRGNQLLLREADGLPANAGELAGLDLAGRVQSVGLWNGAFYRCAWLPAGTEPPAGHAFQGMRVLFGKVDEALLAILGRAFQIADWARSHRFCGACGAPTTQAPGERAMKCVCGTVAYPRISPAMMTLVRRGREILLARNVAAPANRFSALAGFLEPGESVEDAIHREVREEVGLEVRDLRYFASQSWPFPNSLMLAFTAEYAGGEIRVDPREIAEARWFGPGDALPDLAAPQSISRALIEAHRPR